MVDDMFHFRSSPVLENDGQFRIQVGRLMHTALHFLCLETGLLKDLRIRQEIDLRSGLSGLAQCRKKTIDQFNGRFPLS